MSDARDIDRIAITIVARLRYGECRHGMPPLAITAAPSGASLMAVITCKPLCDLCVIEAVREFAGSGPKERECEPPT